MIDFSCACGYQFSVPGDMAGESLQCPECLRLVDVPTLSDLQGMEQDGTIKLAEKPAEEKTAELNTDFLPRLKERVEEVDEYDLRPTADDIIRAGVEAIPLKDEDEVRPATPKYDPETGELVRPLVVKKDVPVAEAAPVAPVINYAAVEYGGGVSPWRVPLELLMPGNITVLVVLFVVHMLNQVVALMVAGGFILLLPAGAIVVFAIIAHYANIIDEVGRNERDELPTPLRGLSWSEDIWHPFVSFAMALTLCYGPAVWAAKTSLWAAGGVALLGSVAFPAVFLTTAASGSTWNLSPDRLLGVIRICGWPYVFMVLLWLVAGVMYAVASLGVTAHAISLLLPSGMVPKAAIIAAYPMLLTAIYLMHLFAWYEGLLYRAHYAKFPWVLQRHTPTLSEADKKLRQHRAEQLRKKQLARQQAEAQAKPVQEIPAER